MANIVKQKDLVTRSVWNYLTVEMTEDGLLSDVQTFIKHFLSEEVKNPPIIWVWEHPTIPQPNKTQNLSAKQEVMTTFEFVCACYDPDLSKAQLLSDNLATRVGASILKNFNKVKVADDDTGRLFTNVEFEAIYPVSDGAVIAGRSKAVPATRIIFNFKYMFDWLKCRRIEEEEIEEEEEVEDGGE